VSGTTFALQDACSGEEVRRGGGDNIGVIEGGEKGQTNFL